MTYRSSPIKRNRRTQSEILDIKFAMRNLLEAEHPMTVRQLYYRLVSFGVIDKTEREYKGTVCRLLTQMRLDHSGDPYEISLAPTIPFGWIADNTRWMRKPTSYSSIEDALASTARTYRRSLWDSSEAYVEVWLEKDALAGVLYEETAAFDVPLMVTRGYPSLTFVAEAAEAIGDLAKPAYLYYFGDHDPSGVDIPRHIEKRLGELAPWAEIHFVKVAVTADQIGEYNLPTRPTKKTDTRSKGFVGESVEVDAIPPADLRALVRDCIEAHVDRHQLDVLLAVEAEERRVLQEMAS
jgi:hypothetical protein